MAKFNKLDIPSQWKDEFTKYPHGYTIFEALCNWTKQVDNMVDNQNTWNEYLDNFVDNFEFELQEEVQSTIEKWQNEGLLDVIIESALNTELDNVKTQLAEIAYNVKSFGAVGDGVLDENYHYVSGTDDVDVINQTIAYVHGLGGGTVKIPSGTYCVDGEKGINVLDNIKIEMDKRTIIKVMPTSSERYRAFNLNESENVDIEGGLLIGERYEHVGSTGEWGYGIEVSGVRNVNIKNVYIRDFWGDGIVVARGRLLPWSDPNYVWYSENVVLDNIISDNNRRQGLSVISVKGLHVNGGKYINTNGTNPMFGIDIEPDPKQSDVPSGSLGPIIEQVVLDNVFTGNNERRGIGIDFRNLSGENKVSDITINNHVDDGSPTAMSFYNLNDISKGRIVVNNPIYKNNANIGLRVSRWVHNSIAIEINNPTVVNGGEGGTPIVNNSAFEISNDVELTYPVGNVTIKNPIIINDNGNRTNAFYITDKVNEFNIKDITIIDPIDLNGLSSWCVFEGEIYDRHNQMSYEMGNNSLTVRDEQFQKSYTNRNQTNTINTITLHSSMNINGVSRNFKNLSSNRLRITPHEGAKIIPLADTDQTIESSVKGSSITIKKISDNEYIALEYNGDWAVI